MIAGLEVERIDRMPTKGVLQSSWVSENTAFHTLARRYCQEQFSEWCRHYEALQRRQPQSECDYSPEAYDTFPRYLILEAMLRAVESFTPESAGSANLLVEAMANVVQKAGSSLPAAPQDSIAASAIAEERAKFITYIRSLRAEQINAARPLPLRRTLIKEESDRIWAQLKAKWGVDRDYWYPLKGKELPAGILAFHTDYFDDNKEGILRELLTRRGIQRIWGLREHGDDDCELELSLFQPQYNGAEGYWTSAESDWLVYASHESSIALAGEWLVAAFRETVPGCDRYRYGGPFSTTDLRGTWEWKDADSNTRIPL